VHLYNACINGRIDVVRYLREGEEKVGVWKSGVGEQHTCPKYFKISVLPLKQAHRRA